MSSDVELVQSDVTTIKIIVPGPQGPPGTGGGGGSATLAGLTDVTGTAGTGKAPVSDGAGHFALTDIATQAELDAEATARANAIAALASVYQSLDPTLTALAAANWAANSLPIGTGSDTLAQTPFAANTFPGRSSSGNLVAKTITDFGLSLVDDADAATARTTLAITLPVLIRAVSVAYAATVTPNANTTDILNIGALTGGITIANPTGTPVDGQNLRLRMSQDATGGRSVAFGASYAFGTDVTTALIPTSASSKWEMLFTWNATDSTWRASAIVRGF